MGEKVGEKWSCRGSGMEAVEVEVEVEMGVWGEAGMSICCRWGWWWSGLEMGEWGALVPLP